ncbi:MAG: GspE/PulE family protein [Gammaproteobacteria bacterium]|jgi:type IV pilus assembly protein PilB
MSAAIDLPMPPFQMTSEEAALVNAPVIARLLDGTVVRGSLQELDGTKSRLTITEAPNGSSRVVPFSDLRYMGFLRPTLTKVYRDNPAVSPEDDITSVDHEQSFRIVYKGGKVLKGKACSADVDRYGVHIYQSKDHRRIHRVFIPLAVVEKYLINPPIGKYLTGYGEVGTAAPEHVHSAVSMVENLHDLKAVLDHAPMDHDGARLYAIDDNLVVGEPELQDALEVQRQQRKKKLGEILLKLEAVDERHLNFALKLQKKYPHLKLGKILQKMGALDEGSLNKALGIQQAEKSKKLGEILEDMGAINDEGIQLALAQKFDLPYVRLHSFDLDPEVISMVPEKIASEHNLIPLFMHEDRLVIAIADPLDKDSIDLVRFVTGHIVELAIATRDEIQHAIDKHYQGASASEILEELEIISNEERNNDVDVRKDEQLSNEKPIVRLVDNIITDAIHRNASDIHIRPEESSVNLLFRIDGTLVDIRNFPKNLLSAVVSRIKILGGMDISERRMPQDGRFRVNFRRSLIDLRISIMPTVQGESVVIRILNTQAGLKSVEQLGFSDHDQFLFTDLLHKSYGVLLVTGPTGCGKSTTLYAALQEIKQSNVNIITIEDPVEYRLAGIQQLQVHSSIGFTFARALRNILRHDPDVVMVGEIRDEETGKIAVESALTGHLVLSTLHTNDSAGSITRLMEMGIESYLVRSAVLGVLAQRLVRRNCPHCLEEEKVDSGLRKLLGVEESEVFYKGRGCDECNNTGYKGRLAVYELLPITESVRAIIAEGVSADEIHQQAVKNGMVPLTEQALSQARKKATSFAEVYRVRLD